MSKHPQQYVYVLEGPGQAKIGCSTFVDERTRNQKSEGDVLRVWHRPHDARAVEKTAHDIVGASPVVGTHEWFAISGAKAIEAVEKAIAKCDAGYARKAAGIQQKVRLASDRQNFAKLKRAIIEGYDAADAPGASPEVAATKNMYGFMVGILNEIEDGVPFNEMVLSDLETQPRR
jgi:hypothetical protein